jgi:hypothetical protein
VYDNELGGGVAYVAFLIGRGVSQDALNVLNDANQCETAPYCAAKNYCG